MAFNNFNCECLEDIKDWLNESTLSNVKHVTPTEDVLNKDGELGIPVDVVHIRYKLIPKTKTLVIRAKFCPFCGVKMNIKR